MRVKILFDKLAEKKPLHTGWGISCLVDGRFIFDTGEKGNWLIENMKNLDVDIDRIKGVIISHDHWDHWGGLWEILKRRKGIKVYACPHFSEGFKKKVKKMQGELVEADKFTRISKDIFISGEIAGAYKGRYISEQALVVRTGSGISVITGCAHPGIVKMVEKTAQKFPRENIYTVLGGFHLMKEDKRTIEAVVEDFKKMGVKKAGPTHCSGKTAEHIFEDRYKANFIQVKTGQILDI